MPWTFFITKNKTLQATFKVRIEKTHSHTTLDGESNFDGFAKVMMHQYFMLVPVTLVVVDM